MSASNQTTLIQTSFQSIRPDVLTKILIGDMIANSRQSSLMLQFPNGVGNMNSWTEFSLLNRNEKLLNLHNSLIKNEHKTIQQFGEYLKTHEDNDDQFIKCCQTYLSQNAIINKMESIILYKKCLPYTIWYNIFHNLLNQCRTDANSQLCKQILNKFKHFQQGLISEYLHQPNTTLFLIFKHILEYAALLQTNYIQQLRQSFIDKLLLYVDEQVKQTRQVKQVRQIRQKKNNKYNRVFMILKMVELFNIADESFSIKQLSKNVNFMKNYLYYALCDFQTKGANALSINIYGSIIKQLDLYDENLQIFCDLYSTLDCYGMHLVKDVWDRFYVLCRNSTNTVKTHQYYTFPIYQLLHIILMKVEKHANHNVPKYCIQSLLAASAEDTALIFEDLQDTVYGSLIQILSTGTLYSDCTHFHQDSKIYILTKQFYLGYYRLLAEKGHWQLLKEHVKKLLVAMNKHLIFEHCVIAYLGIFPELPIVPENQQKLLGKDQVEILISLTNKFLMKMTFRKRHKFSNMILKCFDTHVDLQSLGIQYMIKNVIMELPQPLMSVIIQNQIQIPKIYEMVLTNFGTHLNQRIKVVKQQYQSLHSQIIRSSQPKENNIKKVQITLKQLCLLESINNWNTQQTQNQNLSQLFKQHLNVLSNSSYANQIQYALCFRKITQYINLSKIQVIAQLIKHQSKVQQNLLSLITVNHENNYVKLDEILLCLQLVACSLSQSNSQQGSKIYAKFIQFCKSKIQSQKQPLQYFVSLFISSIKYKLKYTKKYRAIEDCLYEFYKDADKILGNINAKQRLRIQVLLFCIFQHDFQFAWQILSDKPTYIQDFREFSDLYDYDNYDELFQFYTAVAKTVSKAYKKGLYSEDKWKLFSESVCGYLQEAVNSMLYNLDYGIYLKEVISSTECLVKISVLVGLNDESIKCLQYLLTIGEKYWGFQRKTSFTLLQQIDKIESFKGYQKGLKTMLLKMINIQQYRGEDTEILLSSHKYHEIYKMNILDKRADYDGTVIRFATILWIYQNLQKQSLKKQNSNSQFWLDVVEECLKICFDQNSKERLFLTGSFKIKIKLWQLLIAFPKFLNQKSPQQQYEKIIFGCLEALSHNNPMQIKHYIETFMLKLIYLRPTSQFLDKFCDKIQTCLQNPGGQNTVLKKVSYMVISGFILQIHHHPQLFSLLFSFVCSHIAYYRGLSQYFSYQQIDKIKQSKSHDSKYILILYNEFLKDQDAIKLTQKLSAIVKDYKHLIENWTIFSHLINKKPTLNGEVVSQDHYVDKLKCLGHELVKQLKNQDGYMISRQVWKKIIHQKQQKQIINQINNQKQDNQNSFQRKIDPSLDQLYNYQPLKNTKKQKTNLKILVVSAQQIAFYGHMARVGQIFGISELIIPTLSIIDMEDFYNVSVTAQKWLKITEHGLQRLKKQKQTKRQQKQKGSKQNIEAEVEYYLQGEQKLDKIVKQIIAEGYCINLVNKNNKNLIENPQKLDLNQKSLLVIDELNLLPEYFQKMCDNKISFNPYFSYHVQATVFIWEYFKKFSLDNSV